jgi:hypothetical protein
MPAATTKFSTRSSVLYFMAMALPFFVYGFIINHYAVNIPYFDDFSVLLWPINNIYSTDVLETYFRQAFNPNGGHIPLITRLVVLLEIKTLGEINFKLSVLLGNVGWLLTTLMLILYFRKKLLLDWSYLIPIPFLMLTINHWEAMDFTTPAWQMYWGSSFFSVLCLVAIVEKRITLSVYAFTAALFLCAGSLSLVPLAVGYCIFRQRWANAMEFSVRSALPLYVFFYFNPPAGNLTTQPDIMIMVRYVLGFMGNLISNGTWDLVNLAWIQIPLGIFVIASGVYMMINKASNDLSKLLFLYVLVLACMAVYLRSSIFPYTVSRYALYASLAVTAIYITYAVQANQAQWKWFLPSTTIGAVLLWAFSLYVCTTPLKLNKESRINGIQAYIQTDKDPESFYPLMWDFNFGRQVMERSVGLELFNLQKAGKER